MTARRWIGVVMVLLVWVGTTTVRAQVHDPERPAARQTWRWLPDDQLMPRFLAAPLEPSTGVRKTIGRPLVEARVGSAWDVLHWNGSQRFLGFDRAAFGLEGSAIMELEIDRYGSKSPLSFPFGSRKLVNFELETGDYAFGGYLVGQRSHGRAVVRYRVRLIHLSAHLGDGRYDADNKTWLDGDEPIYYSRNYGQFTADVSLRGGLRTYAGVNYITFHSPMGRPLSPWFVSGGIEYRWPRGSLIKPFVAVDARTFDADADAGGRVGVQVAAGFRVGAWERRGLDVFVSHYDGPSWRGQYFDRPTDEWHVGFMLDVY